MEANKQLRGLISKADVILKSIAEIEKYIIKLSSGGGDERLLKQKILDNYKTLMAQYSMLLRDLDPVFSKLALVPDISGPITETRYDDIPELLATKVVDDLTNKENYSEGESVDKLAKEITDHDWICKDLEVKFVEFRKSMKVSYKSTPFNNTNENTGLELVKSVLTGNNLKVKPNSIPLNVKLEPVVKSPVQVNPHSPLPNRGNEVQMKDSPTIGSPTDYSNMKVNPAFLANHVGMAKPQAPIPAPVPPQNAQNPPRNMNNPMGNMGALGGHLAMQNNRILQNAPQNLRGMTAQGLGGRPVPLQNMNNAGYLSRGTLNAQPNPRGALPRGGGYPNFALQHVGANIPQSLNQTLIRGQPPHQPGQHPQPPHQPGQHPQQ